MDGSMTPSCIFFVVGIPFFIILMEVVLSYEAQPLLTSLLLLGGMLTSWFFGCWDWLLFSFFWLLAPSLACALTFLFFSTSGTFHMNRIISYLWRTMTLLLIFRRASLSMLVIDIWIRRWNCDFKFWDWWLLHCCGIILTSLSWPWLPLLRRRRLRLLLLCCLLLI